MIGVFGGTFDPVHIGHLSSALDLLVAGVFERIHFIPSKQPPHRGDPGATAEQRLQMLRLAIHNRPGFYLDTREYQREGPSYMVDTLASLRQEFPQQSIVLILGCDAFALLHTWHQWTELLRFAHLLVLQRPDSSEIANTQVQAVLKRCLVSEMAQLKRMLSGSILKYRGRQLEISSTELRQRVKDNKPICYLVPDAVDQYIQENGIYR